MSKALTPAGFAREASSGRWECPPHLELLNRLLVHVAGGRISRLLVTIPPRHGKSEFISKYFPAWYLGVFPDRRVILTSYEADFAAEWGRKVQDIVAEQGKKFFGISVDPATSAAARWGLKGHDGGMNTTGIGGPLTGRGAHLLLIDDPLKNAEEAASDARREATWDWYISTARSRLEPGGAIILVQTRWHADDLAGRILASAAESGEPWVYVNVPALSEDRDVYAEVTCYGTARALIDVL